jgi:hypothetical protein
MATSLFLYAAAALVGVFVGWMLAARNAADARNLSLAKLESIFEADKAKVIHQLKQAREEHDEQHRQLLIDANASQQQAAAEATDAVEKKSREHAQLILEQRQQADQLLRDNSKRHGEQMQQLGHRADKDKQALVDVVSALQQKMQAMMVALQLPPNAVHGLGKAMAGERPRAIEFNALAARVRGIALVDGVVVSDETGLALTEAPSAEQDAIASSIPHLHRVENSLVATLGDVSGLAVMTSSMRVVDFRKLPKWTRGAYLAAYAFSQRPNVASLDAAVAYASFMRPFEATAIKQFDCNSTGHIGRHSERTETLCKELEGQRHLTECRVLALTTGATIAAGVLQHGVDADQCDVIAATLHRLRLAIRGSLREKDLVRVELSMANGIQLGLAPLSPGSKLAIMYLTIGSPLNDLQVERSIGHLRRFLSVHQASLEAAA